MWLFKNKRGAMFASVAILSMICFSSSYAKTTTDLRTGEQDTAEEQAAIPCVCVPYYYCNSDNMVITNGQGFIDIRQSRTPARMNSDIEAICEDYLEVCCQLPSSSDDSPKCGVRHPSRLENIPRLDNEEASQGEFPWMVTIFRSKTVQRNNDTTEIKVYQCQGTLITERVVLTSAQCIARRNGSERSPGPLSVRVGQFDTMLTQAEVMYQERIVQREIVHRKYNPIRLQNNVALLVLDMPVVINRFVDITCLADRSDVILEDKCVVIGWDKYLGPEHAKFQRSQSNLLKRRFEPYVHPANCTAQLRNTPLGKRFKLDNSSMCAGGSSASKNFCSSEIGAPLSCPLSSDPTRYVQVGVASWCISSGNFRTPSIFAKVTHVRGWIDNQMTKLRLDPSVYRATIE